MRGVGVSFFSWVKVGFFLVAGKRLGWESRKRNSKPAEFELPELLRD